MIGRLRGVIAVKQPPALLLDVAGVGYEIEAPMSTFYELPEVGREVTLHTHLAIKEDAHSLYGFAQESERTLFRALIKVSGVGAKTALSVLSGISVDDFARVIQRADLAALQRVPGIGKKTAERLLLELKDKLAQALPHAAASLAAPPATAPDSAQNDILNALLALGYNEREAARATKPLADDIDVATGIREALKLLAKA